MRLADNLCAGDTHLWLDHSCICSCGARWEKRYRLRGSWGENLLTLAGDTGRWSASRGLAWGLDGLLFIYYWIVSISCQ